MSKKDNVKKKNGICNFFDAVKSIIKNDKNTDDQLTTGFFAILVSAFFKLLFFASLIFDVIIIIVSVLFFIETSWMGFKQVVVNVGTIIIIAITIFLIFLFGVIFKGISNEIENNKDKNYVISVFSAVTGFIALVIAAVALIRGIV